MIAPALLLPPNAAAEGAVVDALLGRVHLVMLAVFVLWGGAFAVALWRSARGRSRPPARARPWSDRRILLAAGALALVEVALFATEGLPLWWRRLGGLADPAAATVVRVVAQQFVWNVHQPGVDGRFGRVDPARMDDALNPIGLDRADPAAADDVVAINEIRVPLGRPVLVRLTSKDVVHSFSIPAMRVKQDVVPGQETRVSFTPLRAGSYEIACAQLCGANHFRMRGVLVVEAPGR